MLKLVVAGATASYFCSPTGLRANAIAAATQRFSLAASNTLTDLADRSGQGFIAADP